MASATERATPQLRTPRDQGEQHMLDATIRLLHERHADEITVRDVAELAGHHHRFVQAWFGGKVGLFRAAFDRMILDIAERMEAPIPSDRFAPDAQVTTRLMNWLVAADPASLDGPRPTPIIDHLAAAYEARYSFPPDVARLMALRVVGMSVAGMLFGGVLGLTDDDVPALAALEREVAELLSAARSSTT